MTALIIIGAIAAAAVLLINCPAKAYIRYWDGKAEVRVKYLWITLYPKKEKPEKKRKSRKKALSEKSEKKSTEKNAPAERAAIAAETADSGGNDEPKDKPAEKKKTSKPDKTPFTEKLSGIANDLTEKKDALLLLWELCEGHLRRLGGKISIRDVRLDLAAADEDACNAALLYGKLNAAVYNVISAVRCFVSVSLVSVKIDCLFNTPADKCRYNGEFTVCLRPSSLINAIGAIVLGYLWNNKKYSPALGVFMDKNK